MKQGNGAEHSVTLSPLPCSSLEMSLRLYSDIMACRHLCLRRRKRTVQSSEEGKYMPQGHQVRNQVFLPHIFQMQAYVFIVTERLVSIHFFSNLIQEGGKNCWADRYKMPRGYKGYDFCSPFVKEFTFLILWSISLYTSQYKYCDLSQTLHTQ